MKIPFFTGACTALVTPFLDGKVNYPMLEMLLKRQMDAGIRTIALCGTTGEAPTLTDTEKLEMFHRAIPPIIAATIIISDRYMKFCFFFLFAILAIVTNKFEFCRKKLIIYKLKIPCRHQY